MRRDFLLQKGDFCDIIKHILDRNEGLIMSEITLESQLFEIIENDDLESKIKEAKVDMLIRLGVDVNSKNMYDAERTPLMLVAWSGDKNLAELLIKNGALLDEKDKRFGDTALMLASKRGNKELVELLISHGADVEIYNNKMQNVLDCAKDDEIKKIIQEAISKKKGVKVKSCFISKDIER